MGTSTHTRELTGASLSILFLAVLIGGTYLVLSPFLPSLIWAVMIVISTWPVLGWLQKKFNNRGAAVFIMTVALLLVLIVPLALSISTLVENAGEIASWTKSLSTIERPQPPTWLENLPGVGAKLAKQWRAVINSDKEDLISKVTPYIGDLTHWFFSQIGNVGLLMIHFLLTVILSAVLYTKAEVAGNNVMRFAKRLGGNQGEQVLILASQAIRAVALGVVGTAFCQTLVASIGITICGIPQALLLTVIMFFLTVVQIGPLPILIPCVIWLYYSGSPGLAVLLTGFSILVTVMDNVLRPLLIKKGANLPLLLIFAGVIGGLIGFGIIGLFIGPVVLAVAYKLFNAWVGY